MHRLARFDVSATIASRPGKALAEVAFGLVCTLAMVVVRSAIDVAYPFAGPFALTYPTVLIATLYGHWRAGMVTLATAFVYGWFVVLEPHYSFAFANPGDGPRVAINALSCFVVVVLAEGFRRAVAERTRQLEAEVDRRKVLLAELDHRTKNTFALVASMLQIQRRRIEDADAGAALDDAIHRVRTFAEAYSRLTEEQAEGLEMAMRPYLEHLIERVAQAGFGPAVTVEPRIGDIVLPRTIGVPIALYLNEALANCAKYAFAGGRHGTVKVTFTSGGDGWLLRVADDGAGKNADRSADSSGLGSQLMTAFARQAGGEHSLRCDEHGCVAELRGAHLA